MLTVEQTNWIYKKAMDFTNKWIASFPKTDKEWQALMDEFHSIVKKGSNNELCIQVMLASVNYFEYLYKENLKKQGEQNE